MLISDYLYQDQKSVMKAAYDKDYFLSSPLTAPSYPKGVVLPLKHWTNANMEPTDGGGVCDCNGAFIDGTNMQTNSEEGYPFDSSTYCDEDVIYIGYLHECYGHMITDSIAKLWFLQTDEYKSNPLPLVYISLEPLNRWQLEILELAGVNISSIRRITEITSFRSIIIPDNSQIKEKSCEHFWHAEFVSTVDLMIRNAMLRTESKLEKKIFFTRSNWSRLNCDFGGNRIEPLFRKKGYAVYAPEKCSVAQQIALLQGAEEFVCTEDSSSHNSLFMRPGAKVVLLRKGLFVNEYSVMIDQIRKLQTTIIDCSMSVINRNGKFAYNGPFFIYPNEELCHFLNIERSEFPYHAFRHYFKMAWRRPDLPESLIWDSSYAKEMMEEFTYSRKLTENWLSKFLPKPLLRKVANRIYRIRIEHKIIGFF